jgi:hypothetical protein
MKKLPSAGALKKGLQKQDEDLNLLKEIATYDLAIKQINESLKRTKELRDNLLSQAVTRKIGDLGTMALVCRPRVVRSIDPAAACSMLDRSIIEEIAIFPISAVERAVGLEMAERLTLRTSVNKWQVIDRRVPGESKWKIDNLQAICPGKSKVMEPRGIEE